VIRIPEELALEIEAAADASLEQARKHFPLSDELWQSLLGMKDELLEQFALVHDLDTILSNPELREEVKTMCIKLGVIRRIERYVDQEYGPLTVI